jgi:hypothetical protein
VWEQARSRARADTQVRVTGGPGCVPLTRDWVTLRFPPRAVTEPASPVRLKKPCAKRPPGSSITRMHQRAGLPSAPPSIPERLGAQRLRAHRGWLVAIAD